MATIQNAAIAAGFMHALRDPDTFAKWQAAQNDPAALAQLIQTTLGLAQPPSAQDMEEMRQYAQEHLVDEHERLREEQPNAPRTVGFGYTTQS